MTRKSDQALLIFTRNPVLGTCKTRLAATIGDDRALAIYRFLLAHTEKVTRNLTGTDTFVYFSVALGDGSIWDPAVFHHRLQSGADLGARMQAAFRQAFDVGYARVALIGSDLYDLQTEDLETAFQHLKSRNVVIGPAADGGYYLLGLTRMVPELFANKRWGTETVFEDTLNDLKGVDVARLEVRNDVDRYEDIAGNPAFEPFLKDWRHD